MGGVLGVLGPRTETQPFPSAASSVHSTVCTLPTTGWASWGRFPRLFAQDGHTAHKENKRQPKGAVKLSVFPQV